MANFHAPASCLYDCDLFYENNARIDTIKMFAFHFPACAQDNVEAAQAASKADAFRYLRKEKQLKMKGLVFFSTKQS